MNMTAPVRPAASASTGSSAARDPVMAATVSASVIRINRIVVSNACCFDREAKRGCCRRIDTFARSSCEHRWTIVSSWLVDCDLCQFGPGLVRDRHGFLRAAGYEDVDEVPLGRGMIVIVTEYCQIIPDRCAPDRGDADAHGHTVRKRERGMVSTGYLGHDAVHRTVQQTD